MVELNTGAGYQEGVTGDASVLPATPAKADPAAAADDTQKTEEKKGNPLTALVQERAANRDATQGLREELASVRAELAQIRTPAAAPAQPEPFKNPHDPVEAPMDFLRAELTSIRAELTDAKQTVGADLDQRTQREALDDYEKGVMGELQLAARRTPIVAEAHSFLVQRFSELAQAQGAKGAEIGNRARLAILQGFLSSAQQGKDAVSATAEMALAMGFVSQAAGDTTVVDPKAKQEQRGQEAAGQSLGGATGGAVPGSPADINQLVSMSKNQLLANNREGMNRIKAVLRGEA